MWWQRQGGLKNACSAHSCFIHISAHTHSHTHSQTHIHTRTCARAHTHTQTHTTRTHATHLQQCCLSGLWPLWSLCHNTAGRREVVKEATGRAIRSVHRTHETPRFCVYLFRAGGCTRVCACVFLCLCACTCELCCV